MTAFWTILITFVLDVALMYFIKHAMADVFRNHPRHDP